MSRKQRQSKREGSGEIDDPNHQGKVEINVPAKFRPAALGLHVLTVSELLMQGFRDGIRTDSRPGVFCILRR